MAYTPPGETRKKIYAFVRERILNGTPPTTREVQQAFGFRAVQSARQHLEALVSEGSWSNTPAKPGPIACRSWRGPASPA